MARRKGLRRLTYEATGAGIGAKRDAIGALARQLRFTRTQRPGRYLHVSGHFAGLVEFGDHFLTLCTDGVGTKLLVAEAMGRWETVGIDCVAMNVNDTLCVGAEPIAFVDYVAAHKLDDRVAAAIGRGLNRGARLANVTIVGGEVALLPELVRGIDVSGAALGLVEKRRLITGEQIRPGDVIIGVRSSGIHSNGLTLARRVFRSSGLSFHDQLPGSKRRVGDYLLEPTQIYVRAILPLLDAHEIHGLAHITGGGIRKNLLRLKRGVRFELTEPFPVPRIFRTIQELGRITDHEMYQTFNMGMGFALVAPRRGAGTLLDALGEDARLVGRVTRGAGLSVPSRRLTYLTA